MNNLSSPDATPIPIHDIAGLWQYIPYPVWEIVSVAFGVALLVGFVLWLFVFRIKRLATPLSLRERTLSELAAIEKTIADVDSYAFGIAVSDILRSFIEKETGLQATTQTSLEFLFSIRDNPIFSQDEKAALSLFLERVDMVKFARLPATLEENYALLESARRIVQIERPSVEGILK